jgi:calcium-translocating P-type ATPase
MLTADGDRVSCDLEYVRHKYLDSVSRGERVICISEKKPYESEAFVALVVLKDKIRSDVKKAVRQVQKAGIQVVMVTGDSKETASAIAEECGIYKAHQGHISISSSELNSMTDSEIKQILPRIRVVSRALPRDKSTLVRLSQELDMVVGMTGDGINDAPSLKLADVGFSMGSGTDIAKNASDIIILDNSFSAIKKTVLYGRTIFKSIKKFITFQLIMNFTACGVSLIGQFVGIDNPITIIQMLWINIIMDTLGGLAFAGEAALEYYMREKPKRRDEPILSKDIIKQIVLTGSYTLALCTAFLTFPIFRQLFRSEDRFFTAFYALFIFCALVNCLLARSERIFVFSNLSKNKLFVLVIFIVAVTQIIMIYFGGSVFRCVPLTVRELIFVFLLSLTVFIFDVFRRIFQKL